MCYGIRENPCLVKSGYKKVGWPWWGVWDSRGRLQSKEIINGESRGNNLWLRGMKRRPILWGKEEWNWMSLDCIGLEMDARISFAGSLTTQQMWSHGKNPVVKPNMEDQGRITDKSHQGMDTRGRKVMYFSLLAWAAFYWRSPTPFSLCSDKTRFPFYLSLL